MTLVASTRSLSLIQVNVHSTADKTINSFELNPHQSEKSGSSDYLHMNIHSYKQTLYIIRRRCGRVQSVHKI
jgi:hypothetical protein